MSNVFDKFRSGGAPRPDPRPLGAPNPYTLPPGQPYRPAPLSALPIVLFLLTCYTTYQTGGQIFRQFFVDQGLSTARAMHLGGLWYAAPLLLTLFCHEMGHFIQARRYRVPASWPYFIPIPGGPLGTMGAVIAMRGYMGNRKALFDIGISGPLAGLGPALICSVVGLSMSPIIQAQGQEFVEQGRQQFHLGAPLLFQWLADLIVGPRGPGEGIDLHPLAYAGWVGIFITALNLIPIGQLDGGHVLYALLRRRAHIVAQLVLMGALVGVVLTNNYGWSLMLLLLVFMGPKHPPTANDEIPLGTGRTVLGWLTLLFIIIGFTPRPFY